MDRYLSGECERVWAELVALDDRVRLEPLYSEALDVARETMRRVRHNVGLLIPRLTALGYRFGYTWVAENEWTDASEREWAEGQPPVLSPPVPDVAARIGELEEVAGTLPLSLRAFYEEVGGVNFVGDWPETWYDWQVEQGIDPLRVESLEDALEACKGWRQWATYPGGERVRPDEPCPVPIAPDHDLKYNISGTGAYEILVPNAGADAPLLLEWHNTTFVNYLRICLRWAGFPGLELAPHPPLRDIEQLTRDLLPI